MDYIFHNEIIDISSGSERPDKYSWRADQRYDGTYPEGAREKDVYFSPAIPECQHVKSDWRYLFKLSRNDWCPWQFWIEIIAYRFGCLIGVPVPPAHVGYNSCYGKDSNGNCIPIYGALIEWFYDSNKEEYVSGGQILSQVIEGFDREKGSQHNLLSIMDYFDDYDLEHWAGVLTLDTLLANTDRHQDNWGIIFQRNLSGKVIKPKFSPAFDNGTAMEYSVQEDNFHKFDNPIKLKAYLENSRKARHHMKWSLDETNNLCFYEFVLRYTLKYPDSKDIIYKHLRFERGQLEDILNPLCDIVTDHKYKLSRERLNFMIDMLFHRKDLLIKTLGL